MAMATADPSPAAVITCARGLAALPAAQTPGTLVRPAASARTSPSRRSSQPRAAARPSACGLQRGAHEERVARDGAAVGELDRAQAVVGDDEALDRAVDDRDAAGFERRALVGGDARTCA